MLPDPTDDEYKNAVKVLRARGYSLAEIQAVARPEMTLRDWFAGQMVASVALRLYDHEKDEAAKRAYEYADAMLAARDAKEGEK